MYLSRDIPEITFKNLFDYEECRFAPGARVLTMEEAKREGSDDYSIVVKGDKCFATAKCSNGKQVSCSGSIYNCTVHMIGSGITGVKCDDVFHDCSGAGTSDMSDKSHMPINGNKL